MIFIKVNKINHESLDFLHYKLILLQHKSLANNILKTPFAQGGDKFIYFSHKKKNKNIIIIIIIIIIKPRCSLTGSFRFLFIIRFSIYVYVCMCS